MHSSHTSRSDGGRERHRRPAISSHIISWLSNLGTGAVFAGLGMGVVLAYRGSGVINFAHGAMAMYAAYGYSELRDRGNLTLPFVGPARYHSGEPAGQFAALIGALLSTVVIALLLVKVIRALPKRWPWLARGASVVAIVGLVRYFAYVHSNARDTGDFILGIPPRYHLADHVPFTWCVILALLIAALIGGLAHLLVFRPLRQAPVLAKVVGAIGLLIVLQSMAILRFGTSNRTLKPILPNEPVKILGARLPRDRFYLAGIMIVIAIALALVYRRTRFGLATRAAAENEKAATLLGYSPEFLAATNWVLASTLAGLTGILVAPISGLNTVRFTLNIVPALGAVLIARLTSFSVTAAAGLGIAMAQGEIGKLQQYSWWPDWAKVGVREGLPFLVIIVVLFLLGKSLPTRGFVSEGRMPTASQPVHLRLVVPISVGVGVLSLVLTHGTTRSSVIVSMITAIILLSLVVLTGFVGQISLATAAFAGAAGFTLSKLADGWSVPFPIAPILAALVATVFGVLVGIPALRVRGVQLAVVTFAGAVAIEEFVFKNNDIAGSGNVPPPKLAGLDLAPQKGTEFARLPFGFMVLVFLTALAVAVANIRRGAVGRRMLAVRANERAAAAAGINVSTTKLQAFALASFIAGLGGAILSYNRGQVSFSSFSVFLGLTYFAVAYLGGIATVSGALIGALLVEGGVVFTYLDDKFEQSHFSRYQALISGVGLIVTAIRHPDGLSGAGRHAWSAIRVRWPGAPVPSEAAP